VLINHLLGERRFWAAYVAMTHDPGGYSVAVEACSTAETLVAGKTVLCRLRHGDEFL